MALTPDDIVNFPLKQSMRGYSIRQVDELLDQVADELERLHRELEDAHRRLQEAERKAETLDETESTLRRTLVTAQRAAEETIEEARRRADEMLDEAGREADALREDALGQARRREDELRGRHERVRARIVELEEYETRYREGLREMLRDQLEWLDEVEPRPEGDPPQMDLPAPPSAALEGEDAGTDDPGHDPHGPDARDEGPDGTAGDGADGGVGPAVDEEIFGRSGHGAAE